MPAFSSFSISQYKSPLRVLLASIFGSREKLRAKFQTLRRRQAKLEEHHQRVLNENRTLKRQLEQTKTAFRDTQRQWDKERAQPVQLPADRDLKHHQFGARMIAFCCSLCKIVGFRSAERVLPLIQRWINVEFDCPSRWTMRLWCCRNGVAILEEVAVEADDWIWLADHSVQLGKMCVLVILGIRQSELPSDRALRCEDMKPLALIPTTSRRKEDVGEAFEELANKIGAPLSIVTDGATELHEGAKWLKNLGFEVVMIDDIKHKAANIVKKTIGKQKRFAQFEACVGTTMALIQQTELDHFLPPKKKTKSRFMNLGKLLDWAEMVMFHLKTPTAAGNKNIEPGRLHDKLGWLLEYQEELKQWHQCRAVISTVLEFTNRQGVYLGSTDDLKKRISEASLTCDEVAQQVLQEILQVCSKNEQKLASSSHASLRLIDSTEVLESSLGSFKYLQRYHNRGTFTTLLAVFPTLFQTTTPKMIKQRLAKVSTDKYKQWVKNAGLNNSTQARKTRAYKDTNKNRQKYCLT